MARYRQLIFCQQRAIIISKQCYKFRRDRRFWDKDFFYDKEFLPADIFLPLPGGALLRFHYGISFPMELQELPIEEYARAAYEKTIRETPVLPGENPEEKRRREIAYLNLKWFMQTLLDRMDRTSMYSGLEARVPLADHRIIEYVWNMGSSCKTSSFSSIVRGAKSIDQGKMSASKHSFLVDSSFVTAICSEELQKEGKQLDTYSFDFTDNDVNFKANAFQPTQDRPWVEKMVQFSNTNHHFLECNNKCSRQLFLLNSRK